MAGSKSLIDFIKKHWEKIAALGIGIAALIYFLNKQKEAKVVLGDSKKFMKETNNL